VIFSQNTPLSSEVWFLRYSAPNWMKLRHKGHLNIRNKFPKEVFSNPAIFLLILDELQTLGFREWGEIHEIKGGYNHGFTPRLEVDDEAYSRTQIYERNQRKTTSNSWMKNQAKILQKSQKRKMINTTWRRDSRIKIGYIERIIYLQDVETSTTSSHSLEDFRNLSHSLIFSLTP
jgi:hypothetical protein